MMSASLSGKVAIVTGASSGIGAATSKLFSQLNAKVVLTGRNVENLQKVATACGMNGVETLCVPADMTNEDDVKNIVKQTVDKFGQVDIVVNNAGVIELGSIENASLAQYDRIMNINMRSVLHLTMLAVPHLIESKGCIVNVSSVNGVRSFAGVLGYNISKAAVDQFTRCTALELAPNQVRVNSVNPGVIITELQKRGGLDEEAYAKLNLDMSSFKQFDNIITDDEAAQLTFMRRLAYFAIVMSTLATCICIVGLPLLLNHLQQFLERSKETHALGRPGTSDEVAAAIAFLASDQSSFITGVNLPVDGGRHAMCPR